jgi:hypothetical protein
LGALGWAYHDARPERLTPPGHHPQARPRPLAAEELITVFAEDLAETKAFYEKILGLEVLGEETNGRARAARSPVGIRCASFVDPAGHIWEIVSDID